MAELCLIVAMTPERVIGVENRLPWHLPRDLQFFKATTMGCPVIMGRKTWESIGRVLPGRRNVVVTRQVDYAANGAEVVNSLDAALKALSTEERVFVIGGAQLYAQALARANRLYITEVDATVDGDAWFPQTDDNEWELEAEQQADADDKNSYNCRFLTYRRKS